MPTYAYRCSLCAHEFEIKQSFHDASVTQCPIEDCEGETRRQISPVGVIFKGSGWYVNDYGKKNSALSESGKSSSENSSSENSSSENSSHGSNEGSPGSTLDGASSSNSSDKNTTSDTSQKT